MTQPADRIQPNSTSSLNPGLTATDTAYEVRITTFNQTRRVGVKNPPAQCRASRPSEASKLDAANDMAKHKHRAIERLNE